MAPLKQYKVAFTWNGRLGTQYVIIQAESQVEAKRRFEAQYGNSAHYLHATEVR